MNFHIFQQTNAEFTVIFMKYITEYITEFL